MKKELVKASFIRALRTFLQVLAMSLPTGFIVTPAMIQHFDKGLLWTVLAWVATALLSGIGSFLTGIVGGLPEVGEDNG